MGTATYATFSTAVAASASTTDITVTDFGTPKGAIITTTYNSGSGLDAQNAPISGVAFTDFTDDVGMGAHTYSVGSTTVATGHLSDERCCTLHYGGTLYDSATVSTITDGFRLTWDNSTLACMVSGIMFGGDDDDLEFACGVDTWDGTSSEQTTDISTGTTGTPNLIFQTSSLIDSGSLPANRDDGLYNFGIALDNGSSWDQCCSYRGTEDAVSDAGHTASKLYWEDTTDVFIQDGVSDSLSGAARVTAADAGEFTLTSNNADGDTYFCWLACVMPSGVSMKLDNETTKTSTGTKDTTGLGFTPKAVMVVPGFGSFNTLNDTDSDAAASWSVGFADDSEGDCSLALACENIGGNKFSGAWMSETYSLALLDKLGNAVNVKSSVSAYASGQFTMNYAAADGSANPFVYLALSENAESESDEIIPTAYSNTETLHSPIVATYDEILPAVLSNVETLYSPAIDTYDEILPTVYSNSETIHSPTVGTPIDVLPAVLSSSETLHSPTVGTYDEILPTTLANSETLHSPVVDTYDEISPAVLANAETLHSPVLATTPAQNFRIQRGVVDVKQSTTPETVTLDYTVVTANAFVRFTNIANVSGGVAAGSDSNKNTDDFTFHITAMTTTTFTIDGTSSGEDVDYRIYWECLEYTGSLGGDDEFIVRYYDDDGITHTNSTANIAISSVSDSTALVPFICGKSWAYTSMGMSGCNSRASIDTVSEELDLARTTTNFDVPTTVAVVEFTGSNWTVEQNVSHTFSADGVNETESISAVTLAESFIVHSFSNPSGENEGCEVACFCWFKDTDELYFRLDSSADNAAGGNYKAVAFVVSNPNISVNHIDSIVDDEDFHPAGSSSPQTIDVTITEVPALKTTGTFASCAGFTNYPSFAWNYRLTSTTNLEWWRGRYGGAVDWTAQIVDFSKTSDSIAPTVLSNAETLHSPTIATYDEISPTALATAYTVHAAQVDTLEIHPEAIGSGSVVQEALVVLGDTCYPAAIASGTTIQTSLKVAIAQLIQPGWWTPGTHVEMGSTLATSHELVPRTLDAEEEVGGERAPLPVVLTTDPFVDATVTFSGRGNLTVLSNITEQSDAGVIYWYLKEIVGLLR